MRRRRRLKIEGPFSPRMFEMLASPAYRALSLSGHRVLSRIEVEYGNHGGNDNGRLPVTYTDFQKYGIDRKSIAGAVREVAALGFVRITERGRPSEFRLRPSPELFRAYLHSRCARRRTDARMEAAQSRRRSVENRAPCTWRQRCRCGRKLRKVGEQKFRRPGGDFPKSGPGITPENGSDRGGIPPLQSQAPKTGVLSISSRG